VFTAAAALAQNVWQLGVFRFLAGVGIGGEWALAGTYVAEVWPESRRKMGAGYLQTGYYVAFFLAAALNFTVGASFGWRAMFLCGAAPVLLAIYTLSKVKESDRWVRSQSAAREGIFSPQYRLWLPEQSRPSIRATAFAFATSFGRFVGAGVNFLIGAGVHSYGSVGMPVATAAIVFVLDLVLLPLCPETRGEQLPG
jgi:predicted MFS family arabinose efflux permease